MVKLMYAKSRLCTQVRVHACTLRGRDLIFPYFEYSFLTNASPMDLMVQKAIQDIT